MVPKSTTSMFRHGPLQIPSHKHLLTLFVNSSEPDLDDDYDDDGVEDEAEDEGGQEKGTAAAA